MLGLTHKGVRWALSPSGSPVPSPREGCRKTLTVPLKGSLRAEPFGATLGSVKLRPGDLLLATASMEEQRAKSKHELSADEFLALPVSKTEVSRVDKSESSQFYANDPAELIAAYTPSMNLVQGLPAYIPVSP
mmetsp:Transcript_76332/g.181514  ORF Transcript_76332/g.181514 Transcript_76332/m.181514 type:complete len:133 (+) Transcript_76332:152-550(+)